MSEHRQERTWTIIECPDCGAIRTDAEPAHTSMCILNGQPFERYGNWVEVVEASALVAEREAREKAERERDTALLVMLQDDSELMQDNVALRERAERAEEALREAVARAVAMVVTDIQENDLVVEDAERYAQTVADFYAALSGPPEEEKHG